MKSILGLSLGIAALAASAFPQHAWADYQGKAYFPVTSEQLRSKILANLDKLPFGIPLPSPKCGEPTTLKYCQAPITNNIRFGITETYSDDSKIKDFIAGDPGKVYDVFATLSINQDERDGALFDTLCAAIISSMRAKTSPEKALVIHTSAMKKAVNRSGKTGEGIWIDKSGAPLVVSASGRAITCRITAQPESYQISD